MKLFKIGHILLFAAFSASCLFADSWGERPDIYFYAHPFVEDAGEHGDYRTGRIVREEEEFFFLHSGRKYPVDLYNFRVRLREGERVLSVIEDGRAGVMNYDRSRPIILLIFLFIAGVILLKAASGARALVALFFALSALFGLYVPAVLRGAPPVASGIVLSLLAALVTLYAVGGKGIKAPAAFAGASFGILASALTAYVFLTLLQTRGFSDEQIQLLNYFSNSLNIPPSDAAAVFLAGIVIAASGVIMDVAMTISSALSSIHSANPLISRRKIFRRGMNIGGDVIASMSGSLLFAYAGGALFLILSRSFFTYSASFILNAEWFAALTAGIFAGTCGMIFTVPLTAAASAFLLTKNGARA